LGRRIKSLIHLEFGDRAGRAAALAVNRGGIGRFAK
jgi:hypothetical protein